MQSSGDWVEKIERWFHAEWAGTQREPDPVKQSRSGRRPPGTLDAWDAIYARVLERQRYPDWFYDPKTEGDRQFRDDYLRRTREKL